MSTFQELTRICFFRSWITFLLWVANILVWMSAGVHVCVFPSESFNWIPRETAMPMGSLLEFMSIILSTFPELFEVCLFKLGTPVNRVQKVWRAEIPRKLNWQRDSAAKPWDDGRTFSGYGPQSDFFLWSSSWGSFPRLKPNQLEVLTAAGPSFEPRNTELPTTYHASYRRGWGRRA